MFSKLNKKKRGQALIEYVMLLAVGVLTAFLFVQMEGTIKDKVLIIAEDLLYENPGVPEVPVKIETPVLKLTPPVAQFSVPTPIYKGRDIHLVDSSYDPDGVIDYYKWNIDGQEVTRSRAENDAEKGLVISMNNELRRFRYSGTYVASLIVIDNDGLVSNRVTKTIEVLNRPPTLNLSVRSHTGATSSSNVSVWQYCSATFYTTYDDPDLPHEVLTVRSTFTDHAGVRTEANTAPNEFTRTFMNKGNNSYVVNVTDEDSASIQKTVSVSVVSNPNLDAMGFNYETGDPFSIPEATRCGTVPPQAEKCEIALTVTGHKRYDDATKTYFFEPTKNATITASIKKGSAEIHSIPYYYTATNKANTGNTWIASNKYTTEKFTTDTKPFTVRAMGRDITATGTNPDPSVQGNCKQYAEVKLALECNTAQCFEKPSAVISLNNLDWTKVPTVAKNGEIELNVSAKNPTATLCVFGSCTVNVQSKFSVANSKDAEVAGIQFKGPNDSSWRPTSSDYNNKTFPNIVALKDINGKTAYYLTGTPNIDSKKKLVYGEGPKAGGTEWWYYLKVIDTNGMISDEERMVIRLKQTNDKPKAVCDVTGSPFEKDKPIYTYFSAAKSTDTENNIVKVEWSKSQNSGYVEGTSKSYLTSKPPKTWAYDKEGDYKIYLKITDDAGNTDVATCSFKIKGDPKLSPLNPEFWAWSNRVSDANLDIQVINKTTPASDVARDGIFWRYYTDIAGSTRDEQSSRTLKGSYSTQDTLATNNKVASWRVQIFATDLNGKPTCVSPISFRAKPIPTLDSRDFCTKSTTYFRMGPFTVRKPSVSGKIISCTIKSISASYTSLQNYELRYDIEMREQDGGIKMTDRISSFIEAKNCKEIGGGGIIN